MTDCLFCKIDRNEIPSEKVYEDDRLFAIKDINPQAPLHHLIIPKKHFSTLLDIEDTDQSLIGAVFTTTKILAEKEGFKDFRVVINCGAGAGQSVFHIHFHLLGGRAMRWPPG